MRGRLDRFTGRGTVLAARAGAALGLATGLVLALPAAVAAHSLNPTYRVASRSPST